MRTVTNQLIDMMEGGILDPLTVAKAALGAMSEAEVADMAEDEGFVEIFDEDDV